MPLIRRPRSVVRSALWIGAIAIGCAGIAAQEVPEEPAITERVEVESSGPPVDVTVSSTVLAGEELRQRGWDLADLLRRVPGARVRDYGGLGSYSTLSLRASTSEQVRILVDGVPQNSAWGGGVDLGRLPASRIETVRVYRGFAPAGLGLGGIGGAVDIRTRTPDPGGRGSAELLFGELGTLRIAAASSVPVGNGAIDFGVEGLDGDGGFAYLDDGGTLFDSEDDELRHRRNQQLEQRSFWIRGEFERWFGALEAASSRRGLEPPIFRIDPTAQLDEDRLEFSLGRRGLAERFGWRIDLRSDRSDFDDPAGDFLFPQQRTTRTRSADLALSADRRPVSLRLDAGVERVDLRDAAIESSDRGGAVRMNLSATAESVIQRQAWTLAPALRIDAVRDDFLDGSAGSVPPPADDVDRLDLSGKFGLRRALGNRQELIGSIGRTFRRPNLLELFGDRGAVRGSPDLEAETAWGTELGWGYESADGALRALSLVAFARRTDDMIRFVPASQGVSVARNLGRVRTEGIESTLTVAPARGIRVDLSLTRQSAREQVIGSSIERRLVYQPDWLGSMNLRLERKRFRLMWDLTVTGSNSTDTLDTPSLRIGSRWIHDAAAVFPLGHGLEVSLDLRNVFDRRTLDVLRYPLPGRVALVGLRWSGS